MPLIPPEEREEREAPDNPTMLEWVAAITALGEVVTLIAERVERMRKKQKGIK